MKKDPNIFLLHILESIKQIEDYTGKTTKQKFSKSRLKQDAVIRRIEIVGEAAKNIPADFKKKHKRVDWKKMAGMRDKLIHEYFGVNLDVVWTTVKTDIPKLKAQIENLLK